MKNEMRVFKDLLISEIEKKTFKEIVKHLPGRGSNRGLTVDINGIYSCNSGEGIDIIDKSGLVITCKIDKGWDEESENLFDWYDLQQQCGTEFEDWDGIFKFTIDKDTSVFLLCQLLNIE
tara:strand:- start:1006 stop:1365 length:360 start_codon:yes stop_codon:yes gene_type:complete